ncbi:helix-turn-helix transcriptional regulator [Nguyenibacter vanlangensis]|uniref:Helix-turn-helix transcriptional regulator n=1 Tax=Nguyenibacter vanlangensis TaxID=1216886 RepID=A0ABZ3D2Q4_9PROT
MIRHDDIWHALDVLAAERGLTPSGLARAAGLDGTSFNPSKRATPAGRPRWPGTESLARVLDATGLTLEAFGRLMAGQAVPRAPHRPAGRSRLRLSHLSQLEQGGMFDAAGHPAGRHWDSWDVPGLAEPDLYAVTIDSDAFDPVFRLGAMLIVSPGAPVRRQDRVILHRGDGVLCAIVLERRPGDAGDAVLGGIGAQEGMEIAVGAEDHLHRIMMAVL